MYTNKLVVYAKVLYANILLLPSFTLTLLSSLVDFFICCGYCFYDLDQIYFINILYSFILNYICFFENANEMIPM